MGFFYSDSETAKNVKREKAAIPKEHLRKLRCVVCPLEKEGTSEVKMKPVGAENPLIYILGSSPPHGCEENEPFSDKVGQVLFNLFPSGWYPKKIRVGHVTQCATSNLDIENKATKILKLKTSVECCRGLAEEDIERSKPLVVVGLGYEALNWAIKESDIDAWRGRLMPIKIGSHVCWFYPLMSPAWIKDNQKQSKAGKMFEGKWDHIYKKDIDKLVNLIKNDELGTPVVESKDYLKGITCIDGSGKNDFDKLTAFLKSLENEPKIATDVETTDLRPYRDHSKILTIAFGTDTRVVSFAWDHPDAGWTNQQRFDLQEIVREFIVKSGKKIAHNLTMEQEWFAEFFGPSLLDQTTWSDTLFQGYLKDTRKGVLSLDALVKQYFGFHLKELSNIDTTRCIEYTLDELLPYNGLDVKYTFALDRIQEKELEKIGIPESAVDRGVRTVRAMVKMQRRGLNLDWDKIDRFSETLGSEIEIVNKKIYELDEVKTYTRRFGAFNPGSIDHLKKMFGFILERDEIKKKGGGISTDEAALSSMPPDEVPLAGLILQLRGLEKKKGTYIDNMADLAYPDGKLHPKFGNAFTETGRLNSSEPNCVAKGTLIEVVRNRTERKEVPIEEVRAGDLVYCYDGELNPTISEVTWQGKTGHKKVVRVYWKSPHGVYRGHVDLTPEHGVRLINGDYKPAGMLKEGERVLALHVKSGPDISPYQNLYFTGRTSNVPKEHRFVYEKLVGVIPEGHEIHHLDEDPRNNLPSNLKCLTKSQHISEHFTTEERRAFQKGEKSSRTYVTSKRQALRILAEQKGLVSGKGRLDYGCFTEKLELFGIDWDSVQLRYSERTGDYMSKGKLSNLLKVQNRTSIQQEYGFGYYKFSKLLKSYGLESNGPVQKLRSLDTAEKLQAALDECEGKWHNSPYDYGSFKRKCEKFGVVYNNHVVERIEFLDEPVDVYDITVENHHNFFANEICVHNSQNFPKRKGKELRQIIVPSPGCALVASDYGQIEARVIGMLSKDEKFCEALWHGYDVHMEWAIYLAKMRPDKVGGSKGLDDPKKMKALRQDVKNLFVFPSFFGSTPFSIARNLAIEPAEADEMQSDFWKVFAGAKAWQEQQLKFYQKNGYVCTPTGRRFYGPLDPTEIYNFPIQGTAGDIMLEGLCDLTEAGVPVILSIHDDLTSDIPVDTLEESIEQIVKTMCTPNFDWIQVPLSVEVEVGMNNWGEMESVGTFVSTDYGYPFVH